VSQVYHVVIIKAGAGVGRAQAIHADRVEEHDDTTVLLRGDRRVFQIPTAMVIKTERADNQASAKKRVQEILESMTRGAWGVQEYGSTARTQPNAPRQGGFIAESITAIVEEV